MPTFDDCPPEVAQLARDVLADDERHTPTIEANVAIGYYFASPSIDEYGVATGPAITVHGMPAIARCKIVNLLDRLKTGKDIEILLDRTYWEKANLLEQKALLDHELYHILVVPGKRDDLSRPVCKIRKHDFQFGWFTAIAKKWGTYSAECQQARHLQDAAGQFFWPVITEQAAPLPPAAPLTDDEPMIQNAIAAITSEHKASISLLQRRLGISYNRASLIIDELERRGIIGPANGSEPRSVTITI